MVPPPLVEALRGEAKLAHNVVMKLLEGIWDLGHFVNMDNFLTSINLFKEKYKGIQDC